MHVLLNDYAGHEFPLHLAKAWKKRGDHVTHNHCASNVTPHGDFERARRAGIDLQPIDLGRQFEKHQPLRRIFDELDYGLRSANRLRTTKPDHVVAAQLPVVSLIVLQLAARVMKVPMILWLQDIQAEIARSQSASAGRILGVLERFALRRARIIVTISDEMARQATETNPDARVLVIENWADVERIVPGEKSNEWSVQHGYDRTFNFIYSGTLGIKHRPGAIARLAEEFIDETDVRIVVVSQGEGTNRLQRLVEERELSNVDLLPLQPAECLDDVLASADVLIALLEEDAASGCVPSKILAYLASGRPTVALFPLTNLASRILNERSHAGIAVDAPDDFAASARKLYENTGMRNDMSRSARNYAETTFDIDRIVSHFDAALFPSQHSSASPQSDDLPVSEGALQ